MPLHSKQSILHTLHIHPSSARLKQMQELQFDCNEALLIIEGKLKSLFCQRVLFLYWKSSLLKVLSSFY